MNSVHLAKALEKLARRLRANADAGGTDLARIARSVMRSVTKLEEALDAAEAGAASAAHIDLATYLNAPHVRRAIGLEELRQLARAVGIKITATRAAPTRRELIANLPSATVAREVLQLAQETVAASGPKPTAEEDRELRLRFLAIGGMTEDEAATELRTRYKSLSALRRLARVNAVRGANHAGRHDLWREILRQSRRLHANLRHLPASK